MKKRYYNIQIIIFLAFIFVFFLLFIIIPDKEFSQQENRNLAQFPEFTLSDLASGKFTENFESYLSDQFAFRDFWITFKARCELFEGKDENNGIYYCENETLIPKIDSIDYSKIDKNITSINTFADKVNVPVYFSLVPGAAEIWKNKLPQNAPNINQIELIEYCNKGLNVTNIDLSPTLLNHSDEEIYYRTDHHWTSLGAYYAYTDLINTINPSFNSSLVPEFETVSDTFYGTSVSSSGFTWVKPDIIQVCKNIEDANVERYEKGLNSEPVKCDLYDESYLELKDKYSMFLGGVAPLVHIKSDSNSGNSILLIRDSYSDSLSPYLTEAFSDIYLVDLRYYKSSVSELAKDLNVDNILIIYSVANFSTDNNLILLQQ